MLPALHLFRTDGADRVAIASVAPSSTPDAWVIRVARGPRKGALTGGTVYGPFGSSALRQRFEEVVAALEAEGFVRAGRAQLLDDLTSKSSRRRAQTAARLGWRRDREAVGPLLEALSTSKRDAPAILDALGRIGDPRAIEAVRPYAERKLLSRRRSGVEALRHLGDLEGLAQARQRGLERLPPKVAAALATLDEHDVRKANLAPLLAALKETDPPRRAMIADVLYEADTPATLAAALRLLKSVPFEQPHQWRYAKSVFKRAMLRGDARTFGWLAHAIEQRARVSKGTTAVLKSGLDGKARSTHVFSKKTQGYVRRLSWRYLRRVARWQPERYAELAAEVLVAYGPADLRPPKGRVGRYGECYLLGRILYGGSERVRFDTRSMRMRFVSAAAAQPPPPAVREESYPERWDEQPRAFLRVASAGKLPEVLELAARGLARHPRVVARARAKELLGMLGGDHAGLRQLAIDELERRFDPASPDLAVVRRLLRHDAEAARELGASLAERSAETWASDPSAVVELLLTAIGGAGARLAIAAAEVLRARDAASRHTVAAAVLEALRSAEPSEGAHGPLAELARRALLAELDAALSTPALLSVLDEGSTAARSVAGALLGRRPGAFSVLGVDRVRALAESELVSVRRAAHALIEAAADALREDPEALFLLAESAWKDTREVAFRLLRDALGFEQLGLEGLVGLCDSAQPDVRALGRELVALHFNRVDPQAVLFMLVEHPAADMRRFALRLVEEHLKPGLVPLSRIEGFVRAVLLDAHPDRASKRRLLAFLTARGLANPQQAELVLGLLARVLHTHTLWDFERVMAAVATIEHAHGPEGGAPS